MNGDNARVAKAKALVEAQDEWRKFEQAIQLPQPATKTFTNEALMFIYLIMGNEALRQHDTNPTT